MPEENLPESNLPKEEKANDPVISIADDDEPENTIMPPQNEPDGVRADAALETAAAS